MQKSVCEPVELINMKESVCECGRLVTCKSVFESGEFLTTRASRARWRACESGERRYTQESVWEYWEYGRISTETCKDSV